MPTLPAALLLDLDDTILSLSRTALPAWEALCHRFRARLDGASPAAVFDAIGEAADQFWREPRHQKRMDLEHARREIVRSAFRRVGLANAATADEMADTFSRERISTIVPFPGALATLCELRRRGRRLGLVTNGRSATQREKIERFGLGPYFDCIVIEEEFGAGKPNPRVFRHALAAVGVAPEQAWMVGDNLAFDIAGAQQLGIHAVWHDERGGGLPGDTPVRPDRVILSLSELLED